jgi:hypothetical protein
MSRHSFDPEVASDVGVNAAIIYQNIVWWCEKNAANGKHLHEGRHWTYNSVKAFGDLFPYMTAEQIRRALDRLEEAGYIGVGNFNATPTDRTKWFCDLRQMHLVTMPNGNGVDTKSYKEPVSKPVGKPEGKHLGDFDAFWDEVPRKVGKEAARKAYASALNKTNHEAIMAGIRLYAKERAGQDEKFTAHPASWLNAGRWDDTPMVRPATLHDQLEDLLNGYALRVEGGDDSARPEYLPAPIQDAGSLRPGDGPTAHPNDGGRYQQEVARIAQSKRFGGPFV